jgi:hypothetical protein
VPLVVNARVDVFLQARQSARISFGSGLHAAMCSWLSGTFDQLAAGTPPY